MSESIEVVIGDEVLDLAALAGVDMSDIQEVRSLTLPAGQYLFKIDDAKLEAREVTKDDEKVKKPVVGFELEVSDCMALVKDDLDPADVVGKKHKHNFWIQNVKEDLGRVQAFLSDIGIVGNKPLTDLLTEAHGIEFVSDVINTKNKDNPDIVYANLRNIMTIQKFQEKMAEE